jgi:disulfide bond formation protein DsbB
MLTNVKILMGRYALYVAWSQACIATFGSLYFSEVMLFPPCTLCWYQRIFMYPLPIVLSVGILRRDQGLHVPPQSGTVEVAA